MHSIHAEESREFDALAYLLNVAFLTPKQRFLRTQKISFHRLWLHGRLNPFLQFLPSQHLTTAAMNNRNAFAHGHPQRHWPLTFVPIDPQAGAEIW
jgi:hypothetical protein